MCVRPVGMNMIFFKVLVVVNMRLMSGLCMFVSMVNILVVVQMRMNRLLMQVRVQMIFSADKPETGDCEQDRRKHYPADPLLKQYEGCYGTNERGKAEEYACSEGT